MADGLAGRVIGVARDAVHRFSKTPAGAIELIAGLGVAGDAHAGGTVRDRSRVAADPGQPNLRQVHLLPMEIIVGLRATGFAIDPAALGENVTTAGIDLMALPTGTLLRVGPALIAITGLRNPCAQIERFRPGLLAEVLGRAPDGAVLRRAGVMAVVLDGGIVRPGDGIVAVLPPAPHRPLERV